MNSYPLWQHGWNWLEHYAKWKSTFFLGYQKAILTHFYCCSVTVVLCFTPLLISTLSTPLPQSIPPIVHAHESSICIPLLALSPSFSCYPPFPCPLVTTLDDKNFHVTKNKVKFPQLDIGYLWKLTTSILLKYKRLNTSPIKLETQTWYLLIIVHDALDTAVNLG